MVEGGTITIDWYSPVLIVLGILSVVGEGFDVRLGVLNNFSNFLINMTFTGTNVDDTRLFSPPHTNVVLSTLTTSEDKPFNLDHHRSFETTTASLNHSGKMVGSSLKNQKKLVSSR